MFIHLGKDYTVNSKNIVAIFDIENTSTSKITREFLVDMSKKNKVIYVNEDLPKNNSFNTYRLKRAASREAFSMKQQHKFVKAIENIGGKVAGVVVNKMPVNKKETEE